MSDTQAMSLESGFDEWYASRPYTREVLSPQGYARMVWRAASKHRAALAAVVSQELTTAQPVEPITLADVLDALNVFNTPRPSEGGEPWTADDFIAVSFLPALLTVCYAAWFAAPAAPAPVAQPARNLTALAQAAGMVSLLDMGAASCVHSEGCNGVTQEHLQRFAELVRADERQHLKGRGYLIPAADA